MKKIFLFWAVVACVCTANKGYTVEKDNIVRAMQDYIIDSKELPNLQDIANDLKKLEKYCKPDVCEAVSNAIKKIDSLLQIFPNKRFEGEGTAQNLRKYVENICNNLEQLRSFNEACNNSRYDAYIKYDWKELLDVLNKLLSNVDFVVELDDKLELHNEKDLANYIINTTDELRDFNLEKNLQRQRIRNLADDILRGKLSYVELTKVIIQMVSAYNQLAEKNNLALIKISHIRDIRDELVKNFFEQAIAESKRKGANALCTSLQDMGRKYNNVKSQPSAANVLADTSELLAQAGLENFAYRAISLQQAIILLDKAIAKNEKAYYGAAK